MKIGNFAIILLVLTLLISGCIAFGTPEDVAIDFTRSVLKGDNERALNLVVDRNLQPVSGTGRIVPDIVISGASQLLKLAVDPDQIEINVDNKRELSESEKRNLGVSDGYKIRLKLNKKGEDILSKISVYTEYTVILTDDGWKILKFW